MGGCMLTDDELKRLEAELVDEVKGRLEARIDAGEATAEGAKRDPFTEFGVTDGAATRAVEAYVKVVHKPNGDGAVAFTLAFGWGEMAAMRRVKLALSDPRARGRALEVVEALEAGASIEAALTAPQPPESDCGAVVIPLRCPE